MPTRWYTRPPESARQRKRHRHRGRKYTHAEVTELGTPRTKDGNRLGIRARKRLYRKMPAA